MIEKITRFFTNKKKTISERELKETKDKLKEFLYNNGKMLDFEVNERLIRLQDKIEYLIDNNYHQEMIKGLNGILVELIDKSISNSRIVPSSLEKLREALKRYEGFIDDMIKKLKEENEESQLSETSENNAILEKFEDIVENIREDMKQDKGVF
jgi:hypothetical protein